MTVSSVVEQWARYPEVAGSIPAQFQLFINFQISWASELTMIVNIYQGSPSPAEHRGVLRRDVGEEVPLPLGETG